MITDIIKMGMDLIDKVIPDKKAREEAKLKLLEQEQKGNLDNINAQLGAIISEANSSDPWTSRARPTFLYVVYIVILSSIPMGALFAYSPEVATNVTDGFKAWLDAIPEDMWYLFGVGYLGYTGARSFDKNKGKK